MVADHSLDFVKQLIVVQIDRTEIGLFPPHAALRLQQQGGIVDVPAQLARIGFQTVEAGENGLVSRRWKLEKKGALVAPVSSRLRVRSPLLCSKRSLMLGW
jgi:hypothetical protein